VETIATFNKLKEMGIWLILVVAYEVLFQVSIGIKSIIIGQKHSRTRESHDLYRESS